MNKPGIEEAVVLLMQHALQVNPAQPSWLRTQADIYFGKTRIVSVSVYGRKMCDYEQIGGRIDTWCIQARQNLQKSEYLCWFFIIQAKFSSSFR